MTSTSKENFTESLKEIDIENKLGDLSEKVQNGKSTSDNLQSISSATSSNETISSFKMEKLTESLQEVDIKKNSGELTEKVQDTKSAMDTSLPAIPASQSDTMTRFQFEKLTKSLKEVVIKKMSGDISEKVKEDTETAMDASLTAFQASQSDTMTRFQIENLTELLNKVEVEEMSGDLSEKGKKVTELALDTSLTAIPASQSDTMTRFQIEKLAELLKEVGVKKNSSDLSKKVKEDTESAIESSLTAFPGSQSERMTKFEIENLTELLNEVEIEKMSGDLSEKVQDTKSATDSSSADFPTSEKETMTSIKKEKLTESSQEIEKKTSGVSSEEDNSAVALDLYLDSVNIGAMVATSHFLTKRRAYLKKLVKEAEKVQEFMNHVNHLRHEYQPCSHPSLSCLTLIPEEWHKLTRDWEICLKQVSGLIATTNLLVEQCDNHSLVLREEFVTYLDNLLVVSEELSELEERCDQALTKYRRVCFNYDNYLFLLHISTFNPHLKVLQERIGQECGQFSSFEEEIGAQIKQAKEKVDDLF